MKQWLENAVDSCSTEILPAGRPEGWSKLSKPNSIEMYFQHIPTGVCRDRGIFPIVKTFDGNRKMQTVMDSIRQLFWFGNRKRKYTKTSGNFVRYLLNWHGIGRMAGIFTTVLALLLVVGFNNEALAQAQEIGSDHYSALLTSIDILATAVNAQSSSIETLRTIMIAGFATAFVIAGGMFWTLNKKIDGVENRVNTKIDNLKDDVNTQFQGVKDLINENERKNQKEHHQLELALKEVLWYLQGVKSGSIPEMPSLEESKEGEDKTTS